MQDAIMTNLIYIVCLASVTFVLFFILNKLVGVFINFTENSQYAFYIIQWIAKEKRNIEMNDEMKKRFLKQEDYEVLINIQNFINSLGQEHLKIHQCKYSELKHPLFIWHKKVFCRSKSNDVICLENCQLGKIPEDEIVDTVEICGSIMNILSAIDLANKLGKRFG